jgi:hypothetical protein
MGKSAAAPPTPDYVGAAKQQGKDNLESAKQSNFMSNPNMYTPFGNQTVTYSSPTFDQSGFDTALAKYNAGNVDRNRYYRPDEQTGQTYFDQASFDADNARRGAAPTREGFTTGGGIPTVTQTLTPQAQQTLDAQMRVQTALANLGQTGATNAQNVLNTPFNPTLNPIQSSAYNNIPGYNPVAVQAVQGDLKADIYGLARANTNANTYGLATGDVDANTYGLARGEVPLQYGLDTRNLTQMPTNAGVSAQQAILSRLDPTIQAGDVSFRQTLANQGLAPGTAAYDAAFRNREMSKNDLYNQAALQGINLDMSARQQGLNELNTLGTFGNQAQLAGAGLYNQAVSQNFGQGVTANQLQNQAIAQNFGQGVTADQLYNSAVGQNFNQALAAQQANNAAQQQQYGQNLGYAQFGNQAAQFNNQATQQSLAQQSALRAQPLNEILGLMGGSQIQLPQFQGYQGAQVAPAPTFAGTQAQGQADMSRYGIQQAGNNATTQGLFSALGTAAMFAPKFSDRRLKSNIVQVGTHPLGIGIYEYDIFGKRELGVMADEVATVMPDAIVPHESGYMMVNYGKL